MKHKSKVFKLFKKFHAFVKNLFGSHILYFQCDKGGEYLSSDFTEYLNDYEISQRISYPHTP